MGQPVFQIGGMRPTNVRDLLPTRGPSATLLVGSPIARLMLMGKDEAILTRVRRLTLRSICGICKTRIACLEPVPTMCGF